MTWRPVPADQVRDAIARAWLGRRTDCALGGIVLRPHQRIAAARLRALLGETRGALLADPVGLGKTYSALAAARGSAHLVIVGPAALRGMWQDALVAARLSAPFVSYESLSRGGVQFPVADFVIADEAHHLRNPATKRYRALAELCARAPVLLLSATPVHNRVSDLRAQLALFLGERAWTMDEHDLARHIVRRDESGDADGGDHTGVPRVAAVTWLEVGDDADLLDQIVNLPAPLPVSDGGDGGPLIAISIARQWASSRAALRAALRRRMAQAHSLMQALGAGRYPSRHQLRSWCYSDGALQLAFPQVASDNLVDDAAAMIDQADAHAQSVAALLRAISTGRDPDDYRAEALLRVRAAHPSVKIVVFTEFAATAQSLYSRLLAHRGVAMLTDHGGVVAGGRITRRELLAQFAPAFEGTTTPDAQLVTMLITTDLLSEGVNLQQAAVVVHADLPWSPARCEQRVGRVRRLASLHPEVFVYALRPPAPADRMLSMEQRLRAKLAASARVAGVRGTIMPGLFPGSVLEPPATVSAAPQLTDLLGAWLQTNEVPAPDVPIVAAVRATRAGFLAVVGREGRVELLANPGSRVTAELKTVLDLARCAAGPDERVDAARAEAALEQLIARLDERASLDVLDLPSAGAARARRRVLHRIDAIASHSPRHLRTRYVPLAREARRVVTSTLGAGAESVLRELADARMSDDAWLHAVRTFADLHARDGPVNAPCVVRALLLLVPTASSAAEADRP
ncbi:MAG TPA: DEAD/DEAH box helicase [Gemmatimonadaceae bacterium]